MRLLLIVTALLAPLLVTPVAANENVFNAPASVVAEPDGRFSGEVSVTLGTGGGSFASLGLFGLVNVSQSSIGDGFCLEFQEEGEVITVTFVSRLDDPESPGAVRIAFTICTDPVLFFTQSWEADVDVQPFTVPVETESFGLIKGRFAR